MKTEKRKEYETPKVECVMAIPSEQICFVMSEEAYGEDSDDLYFYF